MSLTVAIQMDPMDGIDIDGDSSFVLALEAQRRGHRLYHYLVGDLAYHHGAVRARGHPLTVQRVAGDHYAFGPAETLDLRAVDVVLMRQDPPFDMAYITATHLLDLIHPETLVVNDPFHVRNAPEKLLVTHFPELMPETLIARNRADILEFRDRHRDIIVKPLFGNGGAGVFHIRPDDENLTALLEMVEQSGPAPVIVQRYLPEVRAGDKRIILIDGAPAGAISRIPAAGEARANMHVGAAAVRSDLTARDRAICAALGPLLRDRGLIFTGIDIIGDWLTEINVTSPTGLREINRFNGVALEARIWDAIERRLARGG